MQLQLTRYMSLVVCLSSKLVLLIKAMLHSKSSLHSGFDLRTLCVVSGSLSSTSPNRAVFSRVLESAGTS